MTLPPMLEDPAFQEIVGELVAALPERIEQLRAAAEGGNMATVRQLAHQLKGAGGSYGFDNISLSAAAVEKLCLEEAGPKEVSHSIEQLTQECETARRHWEAR